MKREHLHSQVLSLTYSQVLPIPLRFSFRDIVSDTHRGRNSECVYEQKLKRKQIVWRALTFSIGLDYVEFILEFSVADKCCE